MRKTAAVCVAKLHDINSQLVEDQGFIELLKELLSDSIPMVTMQDSAFPLITVSLSLGGC